MLSVILHKVVKITIQGTRRRNTSLWKLHQLV